jgi:hypothetical protein
MSDSSMVYVTSKNYIENTMTCGYSHSFPFTGRDMLRPYKGEVYCYARAEGTRCR